jgi:predicted GIY-YIG superfamily endonuclease
VSEDSASERTAIYRMYDAAGVLLYIGISNDFGRRWAQHAESKPWWPEVNRQAVEWRSSRAEALAAEAGAIKTEQPKYNIQHVNLGERAWPVDAWWRPWWTEWRERAGAHAINSLDQTCPTMSAPDAFADWFAQRRFHRATGQGAPIVWLDNGVRWKSGGGWYPPLTTVHVDIACLEPCDRFTDEVAEVQQLLLDVFLEHGRCEEVQYGKRAVISGVEYRIEAKIMGAILRHLMNGAVVSAWWVMEEMFGCESAQLRYFERRAAA